MEKIFISKLKEFYILIGGLLLCFILLAIRIKMTGSFFFLFLVWNLFLAFIPYACSVLLVSKKQWMQSSWKWIPIAMIWLLFLPNTPYLISDLQHLQHSTPDGIWYDILMLTAFVWYALFIMYLTVSDMQKLLDLKVKSRYVSYVTIGTFILCGFGIYLGRFLRWNSWDIIQNPLGLTNDIWYQIRHPFINSKTWMVTFGYAAIMILSFFGLQFTTSKHKN